MCWLCNAHKGADATDFRSVQETYAARERGCLFCECGDRQLIAENPLAVLMLDAFPVTEGHMLAISRRHVADYFDLHQPERNAIQRLLEEGEHGSVNGTATSPASTSGSTAERRLGKPSPTATFI